MIKAILNNCGRFNYKKITFDQDGWADATQYLPGECDLVDVITQAGRTFQAYVSSIHWYGIRMKSDDPVVKWKRILERERNYAIENR